MPHPSNLYEQVCHGVAGKCSLALKNAEPQFLVVTF